jgi:Gpi18-like mannosyltransferase
MVSALWGPQIGRDAMILLVACPDALFFSFSYTESLFFFMVMVFFRFLSQEKYLWPVAMGFFMPLTKAIGVFMVVPLAWHLWERKKPLRYGLLLGAPILGYLAYFGIMYGYTGNAFEGFKAQKAYPHSPSIMNMFNCTRMGNSTIYELFMGWLNFLIMLFHAQSQIALDCWIWSRYRMHNKGKLACDEQYEK